MKQPEALRLADDLQSGHFEMAMFAAEELRRLHAVNEELVTALKAMLDNAHDYTATRDKARAAIAKAGGQA